MVKFERPQRRTQPRKVWSVIALLTVLLPGSFAWAADEDVKIAGRLDTSLNVISPAGGPNAPWQALGLAAGRIGFTGGSREAKAEIRLALLNWPDYDAISVARSWETPAINLERAWIKFRFPGIRGTAGLGRIGWGTGFVFVPGDLLFDSTTPTLNFSADELRSSGAWLADLWIALGEEAFAEILVRTPSPTKLLTTGVWMPLPGDISASAGGIRFSASPGGVLIEGAWAIDGASITNKFSLSTQFHLGLDWYASVRYDLPFTISPAFAALDGASASVGGFGVADLGESFSLATRHEILGKPATANHQASLLSYHDIVLATPTNVSFSLRALTAPLEPSCVGIFESSWAPLQALTIWIRASVQFGGSGSSWSSTATGAISASIGATVKF